MRPPTGVGILARMPGAVRAVRRALFGLVVTAAFVGACDITTTPSTPASASATPVSGRCTTDQMELSGINGRIVDTDGNPLGDIFVLIETSEFRGDTRTTEDGVFTAPGVTGDFTISTVDIDHEPISRRVTVPCGETVELELVLTPVEE